MTHTTEIMLHCPFCGDDIAVMASARLIGPDPGSWGSAGGCPPLPAHLEDVALVTPLPTACWSCGAPHIDTDLIPAMRRALANLTFRDFDTEGDSHDR